MHTRRLLALAVSVALVLSLALTGCCKDTTDHSDDILAALSSLFETTYGDDITVTNSQWLHTVLASALNGNKGQPQVEGALSTALSCNRTFDDLKTQAPADKDHAYDLVLQAAGTDAHAAAQNAFSQWTDTLNAVLTAEGQYTADLAVIQASGSYYILLHFKVGDVKDPVVPDPDEPADNRMHIKTAEDLIQFAELVNSGENPNISCVLDNDIDLSGYNWVPVGSPESGAFMGTFDGDGHTISNLTVSSSASGYAGLFGGIGISAQVKNLTLANVSINGNTTSSVVYRGSAGALVGMNSGFIFNCHVIGGKVEGRTVGGLVGRNETMNHSLSSGGIIESGCTVTNLTITAKGDTAYAGGIVGLNSTLGRMFNSFTVDGSTTIQAVGGENAYAGGVIGYNTSDSGNIGNHFAGWSVNISNGNITAAVGSDSVCAGESSPNGPAYAGGLIGYNANDDYDLGPINQ